MSKEFLVFAIAVSVSLVLHLLIVFSIYHPGNALSMPLTAGMVFSWLYTSSTIKDLYYNQKEFEFKTFLNAIPFLLKYLLLFLAIYSVINFANSFSSQYDDSWIDFDLDYQKLRGISAFWIFFYMVGLTTSYLKAILNKQS